MSETRPQPPEIVLRSPEANMSELLELHAFNTQMWKSTYVNPALNPALTDEMVEDHLALGGDGDFEETRQHFEDNFNDPDQFWRVAVDRQGAIVGYMFAKRQSYPADHPDDQHLESFFISPDHQGQGLGREFMSQLDSWLDPELPLTLEVAVDTPQAIRFYKRCGFNEVPGSEHSYVNLQTDEGLPITMMDMTRGGAVS